MYSLTTFLQFALFVCAVFASAFSLLLMLITVPRTDYAKKLWDSKNIIALCFAACAITCFFTLAHPEVKHYPEFASMMMLVVTALSACALSYSLTLILDTKDVNYYAFLANESVIAIVGIAMARSIMAGREKASFILALACVCLHILQCIIHIIRFNNVFKVSRDRLNEYYDGDEEHRLKWVRFCYIIMMLTEMFVLVYLAVPFVFGSEHLPRTMGIFALWYSAFLLYFTSNFISFLGSHKILLDAFAHTALTLQTPGLRKLFKKRTKNAPEKTQKTAYKASQRQLAKLEKNLETWVSEKKYREYDKSRSEIAEELDTTKEILLFYFNTRIGVDFRTWRTRLRIEDAKVMLLEDREAPVGLIAERCGFSDRSNFHKQFTTIVGCSPKSYRESNPAN